jgi:hypothetical protein
LSHKADALPEMVQTWMSWWRDLAVLAYDRRAQPRISNIDQAPRLHELSGLWTPKDILDSLSITELALRQLKQNANSRLVLENVFLVYPKS